jgi:hypothetical protein
MNFVHGPETPIARKVSKLARLLGIKIHFLREQGASTRSQGNSTSYLEYFLTIDAEVKNLEVVKKFGSSDHMVVSCIAQGFKPVRKSRKKFLSKEGAKRTLVSLLNETGPSNLYSLSPVDFFNELSARLKTQVIGKLL